MSTVQGGQGNIVTNGLILNLDAANPRSYPQPYNEIIWTDLSGQGNNGTLTNGPTFNNANGGLIMFDGANDYINCGPIFNYTTQNFSFSYWIYFNSLTTNQVNQGPITLFKGQYNSNGYYVQASSAGNLSFVTNNPGLNFISNTDSGTIITGSWLNIAHVRSGSSVRMYINGIDKTFVSSSHPDPTSSGNNFTINTYNVGIFGNTRIGSFSNYNRALNASEVLQNFNATRARFGV
jgi:hypothetical protein